MRAFQNPLLRYLAIAGIALFALLDIGCGRRKEGIIVETSEELDKAMVVVRDWRRSGMGVLDVQISSQSEIPANSWTLSAYDKAGNLLKSGRVAGPQARPGDLIWIRLQTPYRDLFDKADRVVIGVDIAAPSPS